MNAFFPKSAIFDEEFFQELIFSNCPRFYRQSSVLMAAAEKACWHLPAKNRGLLA
jgi:hypothetical protein